MSERKLLACPRKKQNEATRKTHTLHPARHAAAEATERKSELKVEHTRP